MDENALFKLSYGVFMLATKAGDKKNGCIINTCIHAANSPTRVVISVLNNNYTCELIKQSRQFSLSVLDQTCTFETIQHFGFQSGRDVDKFASMQTPEDSNHIPYLDWQTCAVLSCKVVSREDLGTHSLFVAEVTDAKVLNANAPLTYADYHSKVKPAPQQQKKGKKIIGWKCIVCNYIYEGSELPADYICPTCGHGVEDFEPIYEDESK